MTLSEEALIPIPTDADGSLAEAGAGIHPDGQWAVYFYVNGHREWLERRFQSGKQAIAYSMRINERVWS